MADAADSLPARIREVLLNDWDPADVARNASAHGEYDRFVEPVRQLLDSGADEDAIIDYLREVESLTMCFPSLDRRRLRPVARKLLRLRDGS